jgi:hypothetical protein
MNKTLGASAFALFGSGQAGEDSSDVLPMTPTKGAPGSYVFNFSVILSPNKKLTL